MSLPDVDARDKREVLRIFVCEELLVWVWVCSMRIELNYCLHVCVRERERERERVFIYSIREYD